VVQAMRSNLASEIGMACCCTDVGRRRAAPPSDPASGLGGDFLVGVEVDPCAGAHRRAELRAPAAPPPVQAISAKPR
jgi:hypothetical protein